jgi:hypothetical protein
MKMSAANPKEVQQLTFSDYNSTSPYFDAQTNSIYYAADRNNAYNLYRLDLTTGDKDQYTDVIGGNFSPTVFRENNKERVAFTTFFKGEYRLFLMDLPKPITVIANGSEPKAGETLRLTAAQASKETPETESQASAATPSREFPTQGPVISDFQPTKEVHVDPTKIKDKKLKLVIGGRPEVITGVSGDTFAVASGVVLQDILGDQEFRFFTSRIRGFQSYNVGYLDLGHRLQFLTDFNFNDDFFFVQVPNSLAVQTGFFEDVIRRRTYGGRFVGQFPFNRYYRVETGAGIFNLSEEFVDDRTQQLFEQLPPEVRERTLLNDGGYMPLSVALVGETTKFREWGPIAGHTFRLSVDYAPPLSDSFISRTIYDADLRKYFRLSTRTLLAIRARGFTERGDDPVIFSFGGGLDIRGYDFREIIGTQGGIGNLEYRFPLYPNPRIPVLGQMRGRVFLDYFKMDLDQNTIVTAFRPTFFILRDVNGVPFAISAKDGAGSIGAGFTVFAGGLPMNFDFSKVFGNGRFADETGRLDLSEPAHREFVDGIGFDFSIGYDF